MTKSSDTLFCTETHGVLTGHQIAAMPVWHRFFARTGGLSTHPYAGLNTAYHTQDPQAANNRHLLYNALGIVDCPLRILNPCHGSRLAFLDEAAWRADTQAVLYKTDGAFTRTANSYFLVSTADCIPAIFSDSQGSFAGIVHLGWRNLVARLIAATVKALQRHYGIVPESLVVGLGPAIYPCCYHVKDPQQRYDPFWQPFLADCGNGIHQIDLIGACKTQLWECGVNANNIHETQLCTGCHNASFFSCHREGYVSGRFPTLVKKLE